MISVLFVCHGNICRSPMAEFLFRDMLTKKQLEKKYKVSSAGTSEEEIGNPVHLQAQKKLASVGIDCSGKKAKLAQPSKYTSYDYILAMDQNTLRDSKERFGQDPEGKIHRLLDFSSRPRDIADPWYTGDFDTAYHDILEGLEGFLTFLLTQKETMPQTDRKSAYFPHCPICQEPLFHGKIALDRGIGFYVDTPNLSLLKKISRFFVPGKDYILMETTEESWYCPHCKKVLALFDSIDKTGEDVPIK